MSTRLPLSLSLLPLCLALPLHAAPQFVNGLTLPAAALDLSGGGAVNNGRLGYFSDIYYDTQRNTWWGVSDRGPGGGTLSYDTRIQQFTLDVNRDTGAISNFQVTQTLVFSQGANALNGLSPAPGAALGSAFDPEGVIVLPRSGNLLVSDEYGPAVREFNAQGQLVRTYETPANLLPRNAATGATNFADNAGNTAGKRSNRGFEGLAISPDGNFAYAMLQSAMLDEGGGSGVNNRIVKFDTTTGKAVAQYAYRMEGSSQGRGISALVAVNDHEFLVLERNNRGLGADSELSPANKKVFRIDLAGATDVSTMDLDAPGSTFTAVQKEATPWLDLAAAATLAHPTLAALGGVSPEKWEGLAIGPQLNDGSFLVLAGTDNDYSITQNGSPVQLEVFFKADATGLQRIQCDIGSFSNCTSINANGSLGTALTSGFDFTGFQAIPGVLHAYKAGAADLAGYTAAVPEPQTYALMLAGLLGLAAAKRRKG